jgi:hypothetical protein
LFRRRTPLGDVQDAAGEVDIADLKGDLLGRPQAVKKRNSS